MLVLISLILFGTLAAFFATQNTSLVNVTLGYNQLLGIPLYILVFASMLVGIFMASLIHLFNTIASAILLYHKNRVVKEATQRAANLEERVHELETENALLQGEEEPATETFGHPRLSLFERIRKNLA